MGSKLWLIAVLLLAVSICTCYEDALIEDGAIADAKNEDISKEEADDDNLDEMDDDEDDDEDDDDEEDGDGDDEDGPDEIDIPEDELDELDEQDYEDPSPWLFGRRTPSRPRPAARRSWSWRRPRVPSRPRPPSRGSWSWRRPRRPSRPVPRPRPRPPVLPPRPPIPRPRPPVRPPLPPNPPVPTRRPVRPGFWWSRRPRPPVPRPRPSVLPPRPPVPRPRPRPPVPPPPGGNNQLCFEQICSSNPSNDLRGWDPLGNGAYGASRGGRPHRGIDVKCSASSSVYAPFPGKIIRESRPYGNGKPHDTGILMRGTGSWKDYSVKMHYVIKQVNNGVSVGGGSYIGSMTNMKAYFRTGMTNHIHVQLYKNGRLLNPTSYVC